MKVIQGLLLAALICLVGSQVIGIDLGTEFWKASLISPGKNLIIVENSRSSRKSHNGIAFLEGIRHFQYDAYSKRLKKPKATYFYLNKLIESLDQQTPLEGYRFENGTYYFTQGENTFCLEQLVGMILKNIKKYGSGQAQSDIKDAVFTVPAHWGFKARMSLVNAAYLADLSPLGIINENTAAAIHFAITRNDTDPINIGFFNLGSHNLQITIAQFFGTLDEVKNKNIESLRVLSHVSVSNAGGLQFDRQLAEYVATKFQEKHKLDIRTNEKSWVKLLHKCSDAKEVLSANKEVNIYIEGVIDGIDLNMVLKREILEESALFNVIREKLQESLDKAGLKKEDINSVQIIGGASRIPFVNKIVKDFYAPAEVGSHINGDESMAFGGALRAANLSIAFRVKQLHVYDGYSENVRAVVSNVEDGVIHESIIFNKDSEQGLKKQVVVDESEEDMKVSIFYGEDLIHQYLIPNVSSWQEKYNKTELNFTESPKTVFNFVANSISIAELKDAFVNITLNTSTTKQIYELVVQNVTVEEGDNKKEDSEKTETTQEDSSTKSETQQKVQDNKADGEKTQETQSETTEESQSEKADQTQSESKKKKKNRERTKSVKKIVDDFKIQNKKYNIKYNQQFRKYKKFSKQQIQELKEIIGKFEKHENYLREKSKIRNDFQSTLYSLKDDFENPGLKTFSTEQQVEKLKNSVTEELEWLEQNAWTAQKVDFERHYKKIQKIYTPIVNRSLQYKEREKIYNQTIDIMGLIYSKTSQLNETQPWVSEKAIAHLKKINDTFEWIQEKLKKQINRKLNEDIIFYNNEMLDKAQDLRDQYYLIKMTPRPKVVKKPQQQKTEQSAESSNKQKSDQQQGSKNEQNDQGQQNEEKASNDEESKQDL